MVVGNVGLKLASAVSKASKNKVPRYLYHLTSKSNYESILKDGCLKVSKEMFPGVFMTELSNLCKRWGWSRHWRGNLKEVLLDQAAKDSSGLVMLRIPTKNLDVSKLRIRSQAKFFKYAGSDEFDDLVDKCHSLNEFRSKLSANFGHIVKGDDAVKSKLYKQRKEAIEYIYPENIFANKFEKIGEVNLEDFKTAQGEYVGKPITTVKNIYMKLFEGTPEAAAVSLIDDTLKVLN